MRHYVPLSLSPFNHGIGNDPGHDGPHEADAQDDNNLMPLGAVIGNEGLEAQDFSGLILLCGKGELFTVGGSRVLSAEDRVLSAEC